MRIDQKLISIECQAPMATPVMRQKPADPIHSKPRRLVRSIGGPDRTICLRGKKLSRPVRTVVDHEKKMRDAQSAMVSEEMRQPFGLVPYTGEAKHAALTAPRDPVSNGREPAAGPPGTPEIITAPPPKVVGTRKRRYSAAFRTACISVRNWPNSSRRSSRARPNATVACKKPAFEPQSKRWPRNRKP